MWTPTATPSRGSCRGVWRLAPALLGLAMLAGCASTQPAAPGSANAAEPAALERAHQAYRDERYGKARQLLLPLAREGRPEAQYALGYLYYYGLGGKADRQRAFQWIERAAAQGHADAIEAQAWLSPSRNPAGGAASPSPAER